MEWAKKPSIKNDRYPPFRNLNYLLSYFTVTVFAECFWRVDLQLETQNRVLIIPSSISLLKPLSLFK